MGLFDGWMKPKAKPVDQNSDAFKLSLSLLEKRGIRGNAALQVIQDAMKFNPDAGKALFQIEEGLLNSDPFKKMKAGVVPARDLREFTKNAFNLSAALTSLWNQAVATRRDYLLISEEVMSHYLIDRMMRLIVADVLNKDAEGEIIKFVSDKPKIQAELDELSDGYDFNFLLQDLTRDLLNMGEFTLRMEVDNGEEYDEEGNVTKHRQGKGLVSLDDDLDQVNIIAFYDQGWPTGFLHLMQGKYIIEPPHKFAHFIMNDRKHRIALQNLLQQGYQVADKAALPPEVQKELPDYVRVGRPLFMGIIPKLRELQMLETLIPAVKLNQVTQAQIVGVKVPAATATEDVAAILQQFEDLLNIPVGLDKDALQLTISEIITVAGKIRCVPYFDDDKGTITPVDARKNDAIDDTLKGIKDIRAMICTSIGIPYSLLFGSTGPGDNSEKSGELRLFSSYTRLLASIQESLSRGLKQIIAVHLANRGFDDVSKKDFDVKWLQPLTDIAGLEAMELADAKQEICGRKLDFVAKIMANPLLGLYANKENIVKWVTETFNVLTDGVQLFNDEPDPQLVAQQQQQQQLALQGDFPQNPKDDDDKEGASKPKQPEKDPTQASPASNNQQFPSGKPLKDSPQFDIGKPNV